MPLRSLSDKSDAVEFWRTLAAVSLYALRFEFAAAEFPLLKLELLKASRQEFKLSNASSPKFEPKASSS